MTVWITGAKGFIGRYLARELADAGLLSGQALDPAGFPYVLGQTGRAEPNPRSPLRQEWLKGKK